MMRVVLQINSVVHYNQFFSTQIFRNTYYQVRESSLFNRNTHAFQLKLSVPQSNIPETSSSGASEYVHGNF